MREGDKPSAVMARNSGHPGDEELIRRVDTRPLDGPVEPDHDSLG
jgi:hypothetical protein